MNDPTPKLDYRGGRQGEPSPFDDDAGPLTWRIFAWRAGLVLLLAVVSITLIVGASWVVMRLYR